MDWENIIIPVIVSIIGTFAALRLLPQDIQNRKSDTIEKLYGTVRNLVEDLEEANKKIELLSRRDELILRTEMHIRLSDPPIVEKSSVEYALDENRD